MIRHVPLITDRISRVSIQEFDLSFPKIRKVYLGAERGRDRRRLTPDLRNQVLLPYCRTYAV